MKTITLSVLDGESERFGLGVRTARTVSPNRSDCESERPELLLFDTRRDKKRNEILLFCARFSLSLHSHKKEFKL